MAEQIKSHVELELRYRKFRQSLDFLESQSSLHAQHLIKHQDAIEVALNYKDSIIGKAILRLANINSSKGIM